MDNNQVESFRRYNAVADLANSCHSRRSFCRRKRSCGVRQNGELKRVRCCLRQLLTTLSSTGYARFAMDEIDDMPMEVSWLIGNDRQGASPSEANSRDGERNNLAAIHWAPHPPAHSMRYVGLPFSYYHPLYSCALVFPLWKLRRSVTAVVGGPANLSSGNAIVFVLLLNPNNHISSAEGLCMGGDS
ncbi:hypothetical protein HPP92_029080 [Vanilla planifolia]|uniref:Uncharacterized protein n=1 Tax=Vanilla planifolia TaxID=51239 RepID=A0A835U208_VANPL|nr:hypothetical protein HPP92_029069 [Vanilla planifolia]KAG0445969.1 hypothetical protein HPP92_029080 [Vanilla planifolia]